MSALLIGRQALSGVLARVLAWVLVGAPSLGQVLIKVWVQGAGLVRGLGVWTGRLVPPVLTTIVGLAARALAALSGVPILVVG